MIAPKTKKDDVSSPGRGALWNLGAFAVMALAGVLLNVLIGGQAGPVALGVFNQTYATFVICSQLTVLGLHNAALTYTAREQDPTTRRSIALAAIGLAVVTSAIGGLGLALAGPWIGVLLGSPATGEAVLMASPGLFFFSVNKVLLGLTNGRRDMRAFAVGQGARYGLMIAVALVWWLAEWPLAFLGLIFTVPEVILTLVFGGWSLRQIGPGAHDPLKPWLGRLFSFAWRGCFHGMLAETNGRVDVIMIGLFLGDREVGLYSFAAMIAEGFFNILVVGRNQVAPLLARHMAEGRSQDIQGLFRRLSWRLWLGSGVIALAIGAAYPLAVDLLMGDAAYLVAWPALGVLLIGMAVYGAFAPFDTLLMQSGYPGWQSIQMAMVLLANALLNALLIPAFGLSGAALATALSFGVGALVLLGLTRRLLGFGLFSKGG